MVGVVNEISARVATPERHHQRGDDQVGGLAFAHRPANEGVVVEVADAGEVELAVPALELGDVRDPTSIRLFGGEVALQQVRCRHDLGVSASTELSAGVRADQVVVGHQPGDSIVADAVATAAQLTGDARRPIGSSRLFVDLADLDQQLVVRPLTL